MQTTIDEGEFYSNDTLSIQYDESDSDSYSGEEKFRRAQKKRKARLEHELWVIEQNERKWKTRVAEQEANNEISEAAVVELLKAMPSLQRVEISVWKLAMSEIDCPETYYP